MEEKKSRGNKNADHRIADAANRNKQGPPKAPKPVLKAVPLEAAPPKRAGAPKGNLNNAASVLPALKRLRQGKFLPPKFERVTALTENEAGELVADRGGASELSGAARLKIGIWKSARAAELLIWNECLERNSVMTVDENGVFDLQPALQRLAQFLRVQSKCLTDLGLDRKARPIQDVREFVENYERGEEESKK